MKVKEYKVDIANTYVDSKYQRDFDAKWARKLIKEYDENKVNQIILSAHVDGKYSVIDGQHTIIATRARKGEHALLSAKVFFDLSEQEESELFYSYNTERKQLKPNDKVKARYAMGEPLVVNYFDTLDEVCMPYEITKSGDYPNKLSSHVTTIRVFSVVGKDCARKAFLVATKTRHFSQAVVAGLMYLFYKVPNINMPRLIKRLATTSDTEITRTAYSIGDSMGYLGTTIGHNTPTSKKGIPAKVKVYARTIAYIYNKRINNKIDINAI